MPKVSILMNGYNCEKYLKEAIDSIYAQTYKDWEIIFIDNCSTDRTKDIVDSYDNKIKYYMTKENIILGAARNFGLKFCTGKYLAFLDTDDIWLPTKLEEQINEMEMYQQYTMSYTGVIYINDEGKKIGEMTPVAKSGMVFAQQLKRYEINMQSVVLRNSGSIQINENLRHSPDFDLFMDIASKNEVLVIQKPLVKYRKLRDSLTSKNIAIWGDEMKYTLDRLYKDEQIKEKYLNLFEFGFAKASYYKARYFMSIDNSKDANKELTVYKFLDMKYFMLYILTFLPSFFWDFIHSKK